MGGPPDRHTYGKGCYVMRDISSIEKEFGDLSRYRDCPTYWIPKPEQAMPLIESLKQATVRSIGTSAGGRDIITIEYGDKEPLKTKTDNLHSALASKLVPPDPTEIYPPAFYGENRREKPVVVFQGGIHGGELSGTVASLHLCKIIETGSDLRGKQWPVIAEIARRMRICVIPWLNPDGVDRWLLDNPSKAPAELASVLTQGVTRDGTKYTYPKVKEIWPIPPEETAYMGTYYNDKGVNLQYDTLSVDRQPETIAWMKYYLDERPDGVVIWHCNGGSMLGPPEFYLPVGMQLETSRLAGAVRSRLLREGHNVGRLSWQLPGIGKPYIEQMTGTYHISGATPIMVEMPIGTENYGHTLEDVLDIGLLTIEEILVYADRDGLRAYETWEKVRKQIRKQKNG